MLFKKLHKEENVPVTGTNNEDNENKEITEEELELLFQKQLKKINTKARLKNGMIYFIVFLTVLGSFKSLFSVRQTTVAEETENSSFVTTYLTNYYAYPKNEEEKEYLSKFSLNAPIQDFIQELESAEMSSCDIYKVEQDTQNVNVLHYYVQTNYRTKMKEQEASITQLYCKIDVAKENDSYIVIRPITQVSYYVESIDEEETKKYEYEVETTSRNSDDETKAEVENTITLFLKTYNEDIVQAKLLVNDPEIIRALDSNTQLELERLETVTEDDSYYFITAVIKTSYKDVLNTSNKYEFKIDKEKNKISKMEVY